MRPIRDLDLMRLADGELDAEERAELEAALAADPERAQKVAAVEQLGEAVRGHLEMSADEAESRLDRMWDEVEKRIALDRPEVAAVPAVPVSHPDQAARGLWGRFTG